MSCKNDCLQEVRDKCIIWTGEDIDCIGVKNGDYYSEAIVSMANTLCDHINEKVNLKCLLDNSCKDEEVLIPEAVICIIDKICELSTDDIVHSGNLFCIGDDSVSSNGGKLLGKTFKYSATVSGNQTIVSYDLTPSVESLPDGFSFMGANVVVRGVKKSGSNIIRQTSSECTTVSIPNDRFPAYGDFSVRVQTPDGTIDLTKTIPFSKGTTQGEGLEYLNVVDYSSLGTSEITQSKYNELVAAQVCKNKTELEQLRNIGIEGCNNMTFPSTDIKTVLGILIAKVCELELEIASLQEFSITESSECGSNVVSGSAQEIFENLNGRIGTCEGGGCGGK